MALYRLALAMHSRSRRSSKRSEFGSSGKFEGRRTEFPLALATSATPVNSLAPAQVRHVNETSKFSTNGLQ